MRVTGSLLYYGFGNCAYLYGLLAHGSYGRFELGIFFVSSIVFWAKHELTSKAASKSILLQVGPAII